MNLNLYRVTLDSTTVYVLETNLRGITSALGDLDASECRIEHLGESPRLASATFAELAEPVTPP